MDAPSKLLILMMLGALLIGGLVVHFSPDYNSQKILQSNDDNRYYPAAKTTTK